jgi:hypothetical protein
VSGSAAPSIEPSLAVSAALPRVPRRTRYGPRRLFCELTGAVPSYRRGGNVLLDGHPAMVVAADSGVVEHVHAVKYLPVVAFRRETGGWWVIPPHAVVKLVLDSTLPTPLIDPSYVNRWN